MRYAFGVALLALVIQVSSSSVDAAVNRSPVTDSGTPALQATSHDLAINYISLVGPAAINISDTNGRYMWVLSSMRSNSDHNEVVQFGVTFTGDMPDGCQRSESLVLPGQTSMLIGPGEQKTLIWRVRFQCHSPVVPQAIRQTVTVGVTHCEPATSEPGPVTEPTPGGVCPENSNLEGHETNLTNNAATASKQILVQ